MGRRLILPILLLSALPTAGLWSLSADEELSRLYAAKARRLIQISQVLSSADHSQRSPRWESVEPLVAAALDFDENNSDALVLRGRIRLDSFLLKGAAADFESALARDRFVQFKAKDALLGLLKVHLRLRDYKSVQELWTRQKNAHYSVQALLGFIDGFYYGGEREKAVELLRHGERLFPNDERWLFPQLRDPLSFPSLGHRLKRMTRGIDDSASPENYLRTLDPASEASRVSLELLAAAGFQSPELAARRYLAGLEDWETTQAFFQAQGLPREYFTFVAVVRKAGPLAVEPLMEEFQAWFMDRDGDRIPDGELIAQNGSLIWRLDDDQDGRPEMLWVSKGDKPVSLTQKRSDVTISLAYEEYPFVKSITLSDPLRRQVYGMVPFQVELPLSDRKTDPLPLWLLPWAWEHGLPAWDPDTLTSSKLGQRFAFSIARPVELGPFLSRASGMEEQKGATVWRRWHFFEGQALLLEEDANMDGVRDTLYFFRKGRLDAIYRDYNQNGEPEVFERFLRNQRLQVSVDNDENRLAEYVKVSGAPMIELWDLDQSGQADLGLFSLGDTVWRVPAYDQETIPSEDVWRWEVNPWP